MENGLRQLVPIITSLNHLNVSKKFASTFAKEYVDKHFSRKETATLHLDAAKKNQTVLEDLRFVVLKTNGRFLCSDNPVILENTLQPEFGRGYASVGVIFILPISSQYAILLYDSKVYDISCDNFYVSLNQQDRITPLTGGYLFHGALDTSLADVRYLWQCAKYPAPAGLFSCLWQTAYRTSFSCQEPFAA